MKKNFTNLIACLCLLFSIHHARADHMVGSDITWECLGGDTFKITVTAYRDCNGIPFPNTPITVRPQCGGPAITVNGGLSGGADITPVCKKACTRCKSSSCDYPDGVPYGIEQYFIEGIVVLPKNCCKFSVSWGHCCRSEGITTGPTWNDYYIEGEMNRCATPCDNSPYFTNPPVAIYCAGQCVVYNQGVNDKDVDANGQADSLVYFLAEPMQSKGTPVNWTAPFSHKEPLTYQGFPGNPNGEWDPPKKCEGFSIDPQTGDLRFKAMVGGEVTVLAIRVEEWRKDSTGKPVKIGEIRRDLQILIVDCADNRAPIISGIDGTNQVMMDFCAGQSKCFTIHGFDVDEDSIAMTSNVSQTIPTATFDVVPGAKKNQASGTFCWTPSNADVRSYPYRFVVTVVDDACPVNGRASKSFGVKVNASPEATYSATVGQCGVVTFKAFPGKITAISKYEWSGSMGKNAGRLKQEGNPITVKYTKPGTYIYNLTITSVNGCKTVYTDSVKIPPYVYLDMGPDTTVCLNTTMNVKVNRYLGKADFLYNWSTNPGVWVKDKTQLDNVKITKDTVFWVWVRENNGNGCENYDSIRIKAQVQPKPNLGPDRRECSVKGKFVELDASKGLAKMKSYQWFKVDATGGNISLRKDDKGILQVQDSGKYWVLVTDTIGCTGVDSINMYFNPMIDVERKTVKACHKDIVTMVGGTDAPGTQWKWQDTRYIHLNLPPDSEDPTLKKEALGISTGTFQILYKVTVTQELNGIKCSDVDTITLRVYQKPVVKAGKLSPQCIDNGTYNLNQVISQPAGGWWTYTNKQSDVISGNIVSPKVLGVGNHYLYYWYKDPVSECPNYDSALLTVDTLPKVFAGRDTFICAENGAMLLSQINNLSPQQGGIWIMADPNQKGLTGGLNPSFDPAVSGPGQNFQLIYRYENKTSARCDNQDTVNISVYPKLIVDAGDMEPVCSIVEEINLTGTPVGGMWFVEEAGKTALAHDAATNSYTFSPKTAGAGTYKMWYVASHPGGYCPQTDTTYLTVNPAPDVQLSTPGNKTSYCITDGLVALQGTPAGGKYFITAGNTAGMVGSSFDPDRAGLGSHTIQYTFTDPVTNCSDKKEITLVVTDTPWVEIQPAAKLCRGASYDMEVKTANAGNFVWRRVNAAGEAEPGQFDNEYSATPKYTPTMEEEIDGEFTLAVISNNPETVCEQKEHRMKFIISPTPVAAFTLGPDRGCGPLGVTFQNQSHVNEDPEEIMMSVWDFGDGTIDTTNEKTVVHYYNYKGIGSGLNKFTVKLTVFSKSSCSASLTKVDTVEVYVTPVPNFRAKPTYTTMASPKIEFINESDPTTVDNETQWEWNFGDRHRADGGTSTEKNASYLYTDTGRYTVSLRAVNPKTGCDSMIVKVNYIDIRPEIIVFIPNAFTPGGIRNVDLGPIENNTFKAVVSAISSYDLKVYNRWGQLMFHSDKPEVGWDGKFQGEPAQMDVYIYVLKAQSLSGKEYKYTGSVTLIR